MNLKKFQQAKELEKKIEYHTSLKNKVTKALNFFESHAENTEYTIGVSKLENQNFLIGGFTLNASQISEALKKQKLIFSERIENLRIEFDKL